MKEFKNQGGLSYRFRTLTEAQYKAECEAADSQDVVGLTADQLALRNSAGSENLPTQISQERAASSTSDALAAAFERVSDRKANAKAAPEEYTKESAAVVLAEAMRKVRDRS